MPAEDLLSGIAKVLADRTGDIWDFLPNAALPLVRRFSKDAQIRTLAIQQLTRNATSDEKANIVKILARSGGLNSELIAWARQELKACLKTDPVGAPGLERFTFSMDFSNPRSVMRRIFGVFKQRLNRRIDNTGLSELGCDLLGARVRPVAHSLLDALEGRVS